MVGTTVVKLAENSVVLWDALKAASMAD
jgi:hypothetical protein